MAMAKSLFAVCFVLLCFGGLVNGEIFHLKIKRGHREVIDLGAFGFIGNDLSMKPRSNFTILISDFHVYDDKGKEVKEVAAPIGFSLEQRDTINTARLETNVRYQNDTCFVDWNRPERILMVHPLAAGGWTVKKNLYKIMKEFDHVPTPKNPVRYEFTSELDTGFLALFFFNCNKKYHFKFVVEVHEYNLDSNGAKDYLSYGRSHVPLMMMLFGLAHMVSLGVWIYTMVVRKQWVFKIHVFMAVLVVLKACSLLFESYQLHVIKKFGTHKLRADIPTYFFLSMKGIVFFVVLLLLGTGWSFVKPLLGEKDKQTLLVVLCMQIIVNVAMVVVETLNEGNAQWTFWRDVLRVLDIVCCCAVLLPIVWSIRNLREAGRTDGKVARNLYRLKQFRMFYILVVAYIYFTRIVVVLVQSALHWRVTWVAPFILELGSLFFYLFVGWKFRPRNDNPYLQLEQEDFDDVSLRRELEEHGVL